MACFIAEAESAALVSHVLIGGMVPGQTVHGSRSLEDSHDIRLQMPAPGDVIFAETVRQLRVAIRAQRHAVGGIGQIFYQARQGQNPLA